MKPNVFELTKVNLFKNRYELLIMVKAILVSELIDKVDELEKNTKITCLTHFQCNFFDCMLSAALFKSLYNFLPFNCG